VRGELRRAAEARAAEDGSSMAAVNARLTVGASLQLFALVAARVFNLASGSGVVINFGCNQSSSHHAINGGHSVAVSGRGETLACAKSHHRILIVCLALSALQLSVHLSDCD
jgi:hypothetical protein